MLLDVAAPLVLFSGTHIGLSNVREPIIDAMGRAADAVGLVGLDITINTDEMSTADGAAFWPTADVAGRQLFRGAYSAIAFATLGATLSAYASSHAPNAPLDALSATNVAALTVAALAQAISLTSLANPSPLSLVPAFVPDEAGDYRRDDSLKLRPYGLTRITRHPLILPVLPWGIAQAVLAGGGLEDWVVFGGLGLYAVAGCWAQDARAQRSAAVGTVFAKGDLRPFYESTSFAPFVAIADGRQSLADAASEISPVALAAGAVLGAVIEWKTALVL